MYIDLSPIKRIMIGMAIIIVALLITVVCLLVALNGKKDPGQESNEIIEKISPRFQWYDGGHGTPETIYIDTEEGVLYLVWRDTMGTTWGSVIMGSDGLPVLAEGYERIGD